MLTFNEDLGKAVTGYSRMFYTMQMVNHTLDGYLAQLGASQFGIIQLKNIM
jgi:hypothetical protein